MNHADRALRLMLAYIVALDGKAIGMIDPSIALELLGAEAKMPDLALDDSLAAARRAKAIGSAIRGLSWRLEQMAKAQKGEAR